MIEMALSDVLSTTFEVQRSYLRGLAYRMLGSLAEAEDVVQEAWLRWRDVEQASIAQPRAFLTQIVTRLCLDQLKSARSRRETYVGPWLPEPIVEEQGLVQSGADAATELASDLSYAFLLALERLSALERAAFLLHDVFDEDFSAIATTLARSEAACRQLAARARMRIRNAKPPRSTSLSENESVVREFMAALQSGDLLQLKSRLAEDARLISDGGGKVVAARKPLVGRDRVSKFLLGVRAKYPPPEGVQIQWRRINGLVGILMSMDGAPMQTFALEVGVHARISAIYIVRNPDKLKHLEAVPDLPANRS